VDIIEGQMNLFDLQIQETIKPKDSVTKCVLKKNNFIEIISLYEKSCNRIVKQVCGALIIELEDKTLYFNSEGINELELKKDMELLPADEILLVNQDKEVNELQLKKLDEMNMSEYIKRKGDANIIIPMKDKTIVINPRGWVLEYLQKPKYHENEIFITKMAERSTVLDNKITKKDMDITEFNIDDTVEIEYEGSKNIGKVKRIYNNGETINVSWNGKSTAFYYRCVKKVS
jgi:hypothetical protein